MHHGSVAGGVKALHTQKTFPSLLCKLPDKGIKMHPKYKMIKYHEIIRKPKIIKLSNRFWYRGPARRQIIKNRFGAPCSAQLVIHPWPWLVLCENFLLTITWLINASNNQFHLESKATSGPPRRSLAGDEEKKASACMANHFNWICTHPLSHRDTHTFTAVVNSEPKANTA